MECVNFKYSLKNWSLELTCENISKKAWAELELSPDQVKLEAIDEVIGAVMS